jgi:hypothetical protein
MGFVLNALKIGVAHNIFHMVGMFHELTCKQVEAGINSHVVVSNDIGIVVGRRVIKRADDEIVFPPLTIHRQRHQPRKAYCHHQASFHLFLLFMLTLLLFVLQIYLFNIIWWFNSGLILVKRNE